MARLGRTRRRKRLVLDIGTSAIRLAELAPTREGYQLVRYLQRDLVIDPATDEEEKAEMRRDALQRLLKDSKVRSRKTIAAVPGQSVFTRNRPLPPVPEYKVTQIVKYEIQQQIPFNLDQIALDYQVLGRTEAGGYDVMMAAIKVDVVEKQVEILRKVKRNIDIVDVSPIAAYNWLKHTGEFGDDGQCVALVDIGATTTDIVVQKDNQFRFTRSLHVGGNDVTSAIATNFNMTFAEAERLKREKGFAPTGDPKRDGRGGEVIGKVLGRLVAEINRSFAYFRSQPGGGPVQRVIVTGGGACLRNIIPYLQRQLGIEVRIAQPLAGLAISPKANDASEHPEQACVALGLALRCCQNVPIQINLIPPRVREVARRKEQVFYWVLSLATMYLILASIIPVTAQKDEQVQGRIKILQSVIARYDASLISDPVKRSDFEDEFDLVNSDIIDLTRDVQSLDDMRQYRNSWLPYIQAINDARPSGGIGLSLIEAIVIGADANTGPAAWRALSGQQPLAEEAAVEPVAEAAPKPKPAARTERGGGGFADALSRIGGGSGGGVAVSDGGAAGDVRGFPGVRPTAMVEPNGIAIVGYASSIEATREFVTNLKNSGKFVDVWLDEQNLDLKPDSVLGSANTASPVGGRSQSQAGGGARGAGADSDSGGFGRLDNLGTVATPGNVRSAGTGAEVYVFHIDVQIMGKPNPHPQARTPTTPQNKK
jgi:type IV pilus assembly protein PilM